MAILKKGQTIGVCVHHSVYKQAKNITELKAQAKLFNEWHKKKSWAEATKTSGSYPYISYHYLMDVNGNMLKVTDEKYVKYHSGDNFRGDDSFNLHGIAVCLTGNYQTDKPTNAQMKALVLFIRDVEKRYKINTRVRGHKETSQSATACPGVNIGTSKSGWLKKVIANVNDKNYPPIEDDCDKYKKEIVTLKAQNAKLQTNLNEAVQQVKDLELQLKDSNKMLAECGVNLAAARKRITELEKLVEDCDTIGGLLSALIRKIIEKLQSWLSGLKAE